MRFQKFIIYDSGEMMDCIYRDLYDDPKVTLICHEKPFKNKLLVLIFRMHTSVRINRVINIPLKRMWYKSVCPKIQCESKQLCIILNPSWYSNEFAVYLRKKYPGCRIVLHFKDMVDASLNRRRIENINDIKNHVDCVYSYSSTDCQKYNLIYYPSMRSYTNPVYKPEDTSDIMFIGSSKGRIKDVQMLYDKFVSMGLKCYFYVTGVEDDQKRKNDGIIYADTNMTYASYMSHVLGAKCLLELLQNKQAGRTYRMMEAIIHNKKLITNFSEIKKSAFYDENCIEYFQNINDVTGDILFNNYIPNYHYNGEFSPKRLLEYLEEINNGEE